MLCRVKVLIIRFSSIGDIVLTSPVLRCLHGQIPGIEIHYVTKKNYLSIISSNPFVDKYFVLDNNFQAMVSELKKEKYDYVIDLHNNVRSFWLKWMLGRISFTVSKSNFKKLLMVKLKINCLSLKT